MSTRRKLVYNRHTARERGSSKDKAMVTNKQATYPMKTAQFAMQYSM